MLHADLMIRTDDRPLEQRPYAFHRVRVNVAAYPFELAVIDRLVTGVRIAASFIGRKIVGHNRGSFVGQLRQNEIAQLLAISNETGIKSNLAAALDSSQNHSLSRSAATVNLSRSNVLVHILGL